jgi:hypothetical protein
MRVSKSDVRKRGEWSLTTQTEWFLSRAIEKKEKEKRKRKRAREMGSGRREDEDKSR